MTLSNRQRDSMLYGMTKKLTSLSDQIRQAVNDCGVSQYAIAQETGIDRSALSRFMRSERGLPIPKLDTLAAYLRLEVRMLGPLKKE